MKTIGLLGGMSWESTAHYYRLLNEGVKQRLGGLHSARIALVSLDLHEIEQLQHAGDWDKAGKVLVEAARQVQAAGADILLICTNTMHKVADRVAAAVDIPLLHLADATAEHILARGIRQVGLLGTRFTMEQDFYTGRLKEHGLDVIVPEADVREQIHQVIYEELCLGHIRTSSRDLFIGTLAELKTKGAQGVILGCTEIGLLVRQEHTQVPLFDTTVIHAERAVEYALEI